MDGDLPLAGTARQPHPPGSLLGRDDALADVVEAIRERRPVLVEGPVGSGKTALVRAALEATGQSVRWTCAVDGTAGLPLFPIIRLLGRVPRSRSAPSVATAVAAAAAGAVVVVEDLHWADAQTLEVVPMLAAALGGALVLTRRPGRGPGDRSADPLLDPRAGHLTLAPLGPEEAGLLAAHHWPDGSEAERRAVLREAGGNPGVLVALAGSRGSWDGPGLWALRATVASCSPEARSLLAYPAMVEGAPHRRDEIVMELVGRGLLTFDGDRWRATPPAAVALALRLLPTDEQRLRHEQFAARCDNPAIAARHWLQAGEDARAAAAAEDAASRTEQPDERAELLAIAAIHTPPDRRWAVARRAVTALLDLGAMTRVREVVDAVDQVPAPNDLARAERQVVAARLALERNDPAAAIDEVTAGLELAPPRSEAAYWLLCARAMAGVIRVDVTAAKADAAAAEVLAGELGLTPTSARLAAALADMVSHRSGWQEAMRDAFELAYASGSPERGWETGSILALALFLHGRRQEGTGVAVRLIEVAAAVDSTAWDLAARGLLAGQRALTGPPLDEVLDDLRRIWAHPLSGVHRERVYPALVLALADRGDRAAVAALVGPDAVERVGTERRAGLHWARAEALWNEGRALEASVAIRDVLTTALPIDAAPAPTLVLSRWLAFESGRAVEDVPEPMILYPALHGLLTEARALAGAGRGDHRRAAALFLEAAVDHETYLWRNSLRCRWAAGHLLAQAGATLQARATLEPLRATCAELGLVPLGRRVDASLRLAGVRPRHVGADSLTQRQREILGLVAEGRSTREIAALLQLRPATIDAHVRRSLLVLGARSRREAARMVLAEEAP